MALRFTRTHDGNDRLTILARDEWARAVAWLDVRPAPLGLLYAATTSTFDPFTDPDDISAMLHEVYSPEVATTFDENLQSWIDRAVWPQ